MKEVRFFYVPEAETQIELPAEEASHATRVLRLNIRLQSAYRNHVSGRDMSIWP